MRPIFNSEVKSDKLLGSFSQRSPAGKIAAVANVSENRFAKELTRNETHCPAYIGPIRRHI